MKKAISLAQKGMEKGDGGPFGAVIVKNGKIVGSGWNQVLKTNDPTAHAEIVAIRDACAKLNNYWLENCYIYANCEPCPMCLAAIYWARLNKLFYGATRKDAADIGFNDNLIYNEIPLSPDKRLIKSFQVEQEKSIEIMKKWETLELKKPY